LFTVCKSGTARAEIAAAGAARREKLAYYPIWSRRTRPRFELAARLAALAPGDLNAIFYSGGSEAVESAWKLARAYFRAIGEPLFVPSDRPHARVPRHDEGALSITGLPANQSGRSNARSRTMHVANTNRFRCGVPTRGHVG